MNRNFSDLEKKLIHQKYHKSRMIVLILFLVVILTMTIAYSANLSSILHIFGRVNLNVDEGNLEITSVKQSSSTNATHNGYTISVKDGSTVDNYTLVANFDIDYYRSSGSSTMSITYNVIIKNNTFRTQILNSVNNTATFTSGNSTLNYSMSGANTGTTVLKPGESVTVTLVFSLGSSNRNTHYIVDDNFEFEFVANTNNRLDLIPMLNTLNANFNTLDSISKIDVYVINNSNYNITYNFSVESTNFEIVNSDGSRLSDFTINANTQETISLYLKIPENHLFIENNNNYIKLELNTTSPLILTYDVGTISVTVPTTGAQQILENKTIIEDTSIDFTQISINNGIFKNSTSGEITYFYRGNVSDNYVSFANYIWRIIRIDKYGTRLILDSVIDETSAWANSNIINVSDATSEEQILDRVKSVLSYSNSQVKGVLDTWYTNNLTSYQDLIKPSLFCEDFNYQKLTSTGSGYQTYYFGVYVRNGLDSAGYTPEFVCNSEFTKTYNIGLISGDEVSFAGALFNTNHMNYYLYNPSITNTWWTISPSYYDTTLNTVGIFVVNGATGNLNDWQNQSTIANSNAIRPVITVDTDRLSGGSGIIGDEYTFN